MERFIKGECIDIPIMPTMKGLESLVRLLPRHDPRDALLIPDANFLFDLENNQLWAVNSYSKAKLMAKEHDKSLRFRIPLAIMNQYERAKEEGRKDEVGIALVHGIFDLLIPERELMYTEFDRSAFALTEIILSYDPQLKKDEESGKSRIDLKELENKVAPGYADEVVILSAIGYAIQDTKVYIASRDYKDVTNRLLKWSEVFGIANLDINILHRSPIEMKYARDLDGEPMTLKATFTGEVIKNLMDAEQRSDSYPVVIFEKDVRSGDATFDVGVGVVMKRWFKSLELPEQFESIKERYRVVPAYITTGFLERDMKKIKQLSDYTNAPRVVVIDRDKPISPSIVTRGSGRDWIYCHNTEHTLAFYFIIVIVNLHRQLTHPLTYNHKNYKLGFLFIDY